MRTFRTDMSSSVMGPQRTSPPVAYAAPGELTFLDFLIMLSHGKKLIAISTAVFVISAALVAYLLPAQYMATTILLPPQGNLSINAVLTTQRAGMSAVSGVASNALGLKDISEMYASIMKSHAVEDAVIERYGLASVYRKKTPVEARKALEKRVKIEGSDKDGLIRLTVSDENPARAAEIANGYIEQFKAVSQALEITEASQRRAVFEKKLEKAKIDLAAADEALGSAQRSVVGPESRAATQVHTELNGLPAESANPLDSGDGQKLRDVTYYEAIIGVLARQLELARLDEAEEGAFIQVVEPATAADERSSPKRGLLLLGGFALGLTFGSMLVLLRGGLARMQWGLASRDKFEQLRTSVWNSRSASNSVAVEKQQQELNSTLKAKS